MGEASSSQKTKNLDKYGHFGPFTVPPTNWGDHAPISELLQALFPAKTMKKITGVAKLPKGVIMRIRYTLCPGCSTEYDEDDEDDINWCDLCDDTFCIQCGRGCNCSWRYSVKVRAKAQLIADFIMEKMLWKKYGRHWQCQYTGSLWGQLESCCNYITKKHALLCDFEDRPCYPTFDFTCPEHTCICFTDDDWLMENEKCCRGCDKYQCPRCYYGCECSDP